MDHSLPPVAPGEEGGPPPRPRHAGVPFDDDDAAIAAFLEDLSVPVLLATLVHITGDPSWIRGPLRPAGIYINELQGFMSEADQAEARARAAEVIGAFRDAGCVLPPPPGPELVREIMEFLVAGEVPEEYVPLLLEELELDGVDRRQVPGPAEAPAEVRAALPVVIIGAGMSGLLAGIRLGQAGVPYVIVEKNPRVGGTWYENRYPGCRVDVGNHFYCYSFGPADEWSELFSRQPELLAYFEAQALEHDVASHVRTSTEVVGARWDADAGRWRVRVRPAAAPADGTDPDDVAPHGTHHDGPDLHGPDHDGTEELEAAAVISAVGQLNRPKWPDIPGRDSFAGTSMHSARWVDGTDLRGARVAVVGTGASAFQIVPAIAPETGHLTVFQRSAPWMFPNPRYRDAAGPGLQWAIRHLPFFGRWYRFLLFWPACDGGLEAMRIEPDYPHPDVAISEVNDAARQVFTQWMLDQVGDDPELAAKVVPDYVCLGKRTLQDDGSWLSALSRDDVELVTDEIVEVLPEGIRDATGRVHELDVIVWATGFHTNRYLWPMEIVGRDGAVLRDVWGEEPSALLGITVPGFPNLFCLYGPGTNLASGGSIIFLVECQVRYVMGCLGLLAEAGPGASLECRQEAHDAYDERAQAELATLVWSHPSIRHSWFRNAAGRLVSVNPWRMVDYWDWTRAPDPADFVLTRADASATGARGRTVP